MISPRAQCMDTHVVPFDPIAHSDATCAMICASVTRVAATDYPCKEIIRNVAAQRTTFRKCKELYAACMRTGSDPKQAGVPIVCDTEFFVVLARHTRPTSCAALSAASPVAICNHCSREAYRCKLERILYRSVHCLSSVAVPGADGSVDLVVGCAGLTGNRLRKVFVHPDFGRRGIGSLIVQHVEAVALARGILRVSCDASFMAHRVKFYHKLGYVDLPAFAGRQRNGNCCT